MPSGVFGRIGLDVGVDQAGGEGLMVGVGFKGWKSCLRLGLMLPTVMRRYRGRWNGQWASIWFGVTRDLREMGGEVVVLFKGRKED